MDVVAASRRWSRRRQQIRRPVCEETSISQGILGMFGDARKKVALAPGAGFEPATIRLTVECSTAELSGNRRTVFAGRAAYNTVFAGRAAYNKGSRYCKGRIGSFPIG